MQFSKHLHHIIGTAWSDIVANFLKDQTFIPYLHETSMIAGYTLVTDF